MARGSRAAGSKPKRSQGDVGRTILRENPSLGILAGSTGNDFMPAMRSFLYNDVNGDDFVLNATGIGQIQAVVDGIKSHASPALSQDLDALMVDVNAQANKRMSEAITSMLLE